MYRIMVAKSKRSNYETMYQFMTTTTDGVTTPLEIESKEKLDEKIEKMLNDDGYSKADFIVVTVVDYSVDATSYTDDGDEDGGDDSSSSCTGDCTCQDVATEDDIDAALNGDLDDEGDDNTESGND